MVTHTYPMNTFFLIFLLQIHGISLSSLLLFSLCQNSKQKSGARDTRRNERGVLESYRKDIQSSVLYITKVIQKIMTVRAFLPHS